MGSSSGSLDTDSFAFTKHPFMTPQPPPSSSTTFSSLLAGGGAAESDDAPPTRAGSGTGFSDRIAERTGSGVPKFKSITPPSLPISPPSLFSPSSYFAIPPGLSPAELLDSPVLLNSSSNILPSPTTGTFPINAFNWRGDYESMKNVKQEDNKNLSSDFTFQTHTKTSSRMTIQPQSGENNTVKSEFGSMQSFSPEIASIQANSNTNNGSFQPDYNGNYNPQQVGQSIREQRKSDDGYNWRKYGQKQVKGSENPRSYYKCTFPNCPTKKKVERSLDGQITEIVYKGTHNHPKPQSTRRSSSTSSYQSSSNMAAISQALQASNPALSESYSNHGSTLQADSNGATPENSSISIGDDEYDQKSKSVGDDIDEDEPDAKRWRKEGGENEGISAPGSRTVREPRVVVQTTSDIDILDDGYRWRKYGQKVVKGNPNPRSYYKCTNPGCPVRKHVERASHDLRAVITTYEGKHNHDVPAARGSGLSRQMPLPDHSNNNIGNNNNNVTMPFSALMTNHHLDHNPTLNPIRSSRLPEASDGQSPFTLEMLQNSGEFRFSGYMNSIMNQPQSNDVFSKGAKEEPRDDMFLESLLC